MRRLRTHGPTPPLGRALLALQALAALAFVAALLHAEGVRLPLRDHGDWTVHAVFADAGGLPAGRAPVLVAGVPSGRVEHVAVRDGRAVATLRLDRAARGVLRRDAAAVLEPRSALEDLTVDLRPGSRSAPALRPGATIGPARTTSGVGFDQVVSVLDADTRAQVGIALGALADAVRAQPGALRAAVLRLEPAVTGVQRVTSALDRRRVLLTRLVGAVDRLSAATAARQGELASALAAARRTLTVTSARQSELRAAVGALPATLRAVDGALSAARTTAAPLDGALTALRPAVREAPATLAAVRAALPAAGGLLGDAAAFTRDAATPLRHAASAARRAPGLARTLLPAAAQLGPVVDAVDAHRDGVKLLGERFSGVLSTNDANGPVLRGLGFFEPFDPANFGFPGATGARLATAKADAVRALVRVCEHSNPVACLVRYLVPGLPGAVRSVAAALTTPHRP